MNKHGGCPHCGVDLNGGSIWQTFFEKYGSEVEADRISAMYGATREKGQWSRAIAVYSLETDKTVAWQCPDCSHEWAR